MLMEAADSITPSQIHSKRLSSGRQSIINAFLGIKLLIDLEIAQLCVTCHKSSRAISEVFWKSIQMKIIQPRYMLNCLKFSDKQVFLHFTSNRLSQGKIAVSLLAYRSFIIEFSWVFSTENVSIVISLHD